MGAVMLPVLGLVLKIFALACSLVIEGSAGNHLWVHYYCVQELFEDLGYKNLVLTCIYISDGLIGLFLDWYKLLEDKNELNDVNSEWSDFWYLYGNYWCNAMLTHGQRIWIRSFSIVSFCLCCIYHLFWWICPKK